MLVLDADSDKNDDRYYIREHLIYLLYGEVGAGRDVQIKYIESAEEHRFPDSPVRTPDREDYQRDSEPSSVTERVVRPYSACVVEYVVESAYARDHASDADREVFVSVDIDTL